MVPKKTEDEFLKPELFSLSNDDCRHRKIIDILDKQDFKLLSVLKDDSGFAKLNLFTTLAKFGNRNPGLSLTSKGVSLPSDKTSKTPLDYVTCASEFFKRIQKGSIYYRRLLLIHRPRGTTNHLQNQD